MTQQSDVQDLRGKHNLSDAEFEQISSLLAQMRVIPASKSSNMIREEHRRLRRVLSFLTKRNAALQKDVLYLLWETSKVAKQSIAEQRRERQARKQRTDTQDVVII